MKAKEESKEVVDKVAVTKSVADEADNSTERHTRNK